MSVISALIALQKKSNSPSIGVVKILKQIEPQCVHLSMFLQMKLRWHKILGQSVNGLLSAISNLWLTYSELSILFIYRCSCRESRRMTV